MAPWYVARTISSMIKELSGVTFVLEDMALYLFEVLFYFRRFA